MLSGTFRALRQVHQGRDPEIRYGWGQASFDAHLDHDSPGWGQKRRSHRPEGVPKHDRILAIPDSDETGHSVRNLLIRALSVFAAHVSSSSRQADPQVPSFHTWVWSLVFGLLLSFSLWVFWCGSCWLSCWEKVHFGDLSVSWIFSYILVFSQVVYHPIHRRSWVCCCCYLLFPVALDDSYSERLWVRV
jgi:hypothetical protein